MRLSAETDYALTALRWLAAEGPEAVVEAAELASRIDVPPAFLSKILQRLARAGIVRGHRGSARGYGLARPAGEISVRAVAETLEGPSFFERCIFWANECSDREPCALHHVWARVRPQVRDALDRLTIAEIAHKKKSVRRSARSRPVRRRK